MLLLKSSGVILTICEGSIITVLSDYISDSVDIGNEITDVYILNTWIMVCSERKIHVLKFTTTSHEVIYSMPISFKRYIPYGDSLIGITSNRYLISVSGRSVNIDALRDNSISSIVDRELLDLSHGICYSDNGYLFWNNIIYRFDDMTPVDSLVIDHNSCMLISIDSKLYGLGDNSYNKLGIEDIQYLHNITCIDYVECVSYVTYYSECTLIVSLDSMYVSGLLLHKHYSVYTKIH